MNAVYRKKSFFIAKHQTLKSYYRAYVSPTRSTSLVCESRQVTD